jgi:hypothetical protein
MVTKKYICEVTGFHGVGYEMTVWQKFSEVLEVLAASIIRAMTHRPDVRGSKHL